MDEDEDLEWDEQTYYTGECTCEHEDTDHGWGSCDQPLPDGAVCLCEAGWEL